MRKIFEEFFCNNCCDRTQNCCDLGIGSQTLKPSARSHPNRTQIKNLTSVCWQQRSRPLDIVTQSLKCVLRRKSMNVKHFSIGNLSNTHGRHWIMD
jgi:hypothetical protein